MDALGGVVAEAGAAAAAEDVGVAVFGVAAGWVAADGEEVPVDAAVGVVAEAEAPAEADDVGVAVFAAAADGVAADDELEGAGVGATSARMAARAPARLVAAAAEAVGGRVDAAGVLAGGDADGAGVALDMLLLADADALPVPLGAEVAAAATVLPAGELLVATAPVGVTSKPLPAAAKSAAVDGEPGEAEADAAALPGAAVGASVADGVGPAGVGDLAKGCTTGTLALAVAVCPVAAAAAVGVARNEISCPSGVVPIGWASAAACSRLRCGC